MKYGSYQPYGEASSACQHNGEAKFAHQGGVYTVRLPKFSSIATRVQVQLSSGIHITSVGE